VIAVADSYSATFSTRRLNVTSPTNIAAVLTRVLAGLRKRGVKQSR